MIVKDIFGAQTFVNGIDNNQTYIHRMDGGVVITVNAGHWRKSMDTAFTMGAALAQGNKSGMERAADAAMSRAQMSNTPFSCRVSHEIKLLPAPAATLV